MHIVIYSKKDCIWCDKAKTLLKDNNMQYKELTLHVDYSPEDLKKILEKNSRITVPQIFIDNQHIGGYEDLRSYLKK